MSSKYICIHGHFYQPPRENPETGEFDKEPSAAPFYNWNERIYQECYKPNTEAAIIDNSGKVLRRVNNYEYLSFNFGPTLLDWIKQKHPDRLSKIIEADKISVKKHNGHGNAIAQVYNHIIMPLANRRDKITQIRWGVKHFQFHFGRMPESIWLAETACDNRTLECLIEENIRYIILDPSQALKIRKISNNKFSEDWIDVSGGKINPKIPYRYFSQNKSRQNNDFIDIFFYDGPLSKGIAFDNMVYDTKKILERINFAKLDNYDRNQLISIAVDGETFGHHKHHTERTIAFLFDEYAEQNGYKITNFGEYLDIEPPVHEVNINEGPYNEGTSWSCIHGVGRWKENCGCNAGGGQNWNQEWRRPLRNAINQLNCKISLLYESEGRKYFKDIWDARNDYIDVLLEPDRKKEFFNKHGLKKFTSKDIKYCSDLLEMQRYSMLMFTSCGWFFSDISGIEAKKILSYAKYAVKFAENLSGLNFESDFIEELSKAKSNLSASDSDFSGKDGGEIYYNL